MNKRGISAVVATVLIILITVAAITLIWTVILPLVKDSLPSGSVVADLSIVSSEGYTFYDLQNGALCVQIRKGLDSNIPGVQVALTFNGKSYSSIVRAPENGQSARYCFNITGYPSPDSITIAPVFRKGGAFQPGSVSGSLDRVPEGVFGSDGVLLTLGVNQLDSSVEPLINCKPDCTNKNCGESNGCGGKCTGPCPDRGTCISGVCQAFVCNETINCGAWVSVGCVSLTQRNESRTCEQGCESFPTSRLVDDSSCSPLNSPNLVSYWHMDGDGSDSKGISPLSIMGGTFVPARMGQGLSFNGTNLSYSNASIFTLYGNAFTVMAWFKSSAVSNDGKIFSTSAAFHELQIYQGKIRFCVGGCVFGTTLINDSNWHFAATVGNDSGVYAFLDGNKNPEVSKAVYAASISGFARVGAHGGGMTQPYSSVSYPLNGTIDELMVFNRSLSFDEIQRVYNGQK